MAQVVEHLAVLQENPGLILGKAENYFNEEKIEEQEEKLLKEFLGLWPKAANKKFGDHQPALLIFIKNFSGARAFFIALHLGIFWSNALFHPSCQIRKSPN